MVTALCFGGNWLDTDDDTRVTLQWTNNLIEFGTPKMVHTLDLSVPATPKNCEVFGYGENETFYGLRLRVGGYLSIGGMLIEGLFGVVSVESGRFNLIFTYGNTVGTGLDHSLQSLMQSSSTSISFDGKDDIIPNTTMTWGWVNYMNNAHPNGSMGASSSPLIMPSANLGYIMNAAAASLGFTVYVDGVNITTMQGGGIPTSPYSYMFTLPTCTSTPLEYAVEVSDFTPDMRTATTPVINVTESGTPSTLLAAGLAYTEPTEKNFVESMWFVRRYVRVFTCLRDLKVKFPFRGSPYRNLIVAFGNGKDFKDCLRSNGQPAWTEYTCDALTNEAFSFVSEQYWNYSLWRLNAFNHEMITSANPYTFYTYSSEGNVGTGETLDLWNNLPDMTLMELLLAFCRIVCGGLTYDVANNRIDITTFTGVINNAKTNDALIQNGDIVKRGIITRYIDGWARHNYITTKGDEDDELRYKMDLQVDSQMVDEERDLGEIPFKSGGYNFNGTLYNLYISDDVEVNDDGDVCYNQNSYIAYLTSNPNFVPQHLNYVKAANNENFNTFTKNTDEVAVSVLIPLTDFMSLEMGSTAALFGRSWLIRSATWSDGVAELKLLSINFADMQ